MNVESIEALIAFASALDAIEPVTKTQTADTGKYTYRYADLGDVLDECKRAARMFGLSIFQAPTVIDGHLAVQTTLIHRNGGTVEPPPLMMVLPKEAQAYGSALTYARRYALMTLFGIAPEDDDGRAATVAAQTEPGRRTEAERMIREVIAQMSADARRKFTNEFREEFGMGLSDLPASAHGEALTWTRRWIESDDQADREFAEQGKGE